MHFRTKYSSQRQRSNPCVFHRSDKKLILNSDLTRPSVKHSLGTRVTTSTLSPGSCRKRTTRNNCCVFPFIYHGTQYFECTDKDIKKPWCATTSNYDIDGMWGHCIGKKIYRILCQPATWLIFCTLGGSRS